MFAIELHTHSVETHVQEASMYVNHRVQTQTTQHPWQHFRAVPGGTHSVTITHTQRERAKECVLDMYGQST